MDVDEQQNRKKLNDIKPKITIIVNKTIIFKEKYYQLIRVSLSLLCKKKETIKKFT